MATALPLLPGEEIAPEQVPRGKHGRVTLGPGLRHIPPTTVAATTAGVLRVDERRAALWLESGGGGGSGGRYQPSVGDLVIAQVQRSSGGGGGGGGVGGGEHFQCALTPHAAPVLLGQLAFEGASKKTRPQLRAGDLVYGRISRAAGRGEEAEMEGYNAATGKAEGMGPLTGGMVFRVSPAFTRRLMMMGGPAAAAAGPGRVVVLEELGEKMRFEVAVGRNGRVWVDSGSVAETAMIGRLLTQADEEAWDVETQKKAVKKALKTGGG